MIGKLNMVKNRLSDRLNDDIFGLIKNLIKDDIIYL